MNEVAPALPYNVAAQLLARAGQSVLADHAFGDSEVTWYLGEEIIAYGYFSSRSKSVSFEEGILKRKGFVTGKFTGEEASKLQYLGGDRDFHRNDMQGSGYY